jgi:calcineurin-like phosphoesterase family protein
MDMMKTFYTSDPHYGHYTSSERNILKFCNRPFQTIEEHDEALIKNWNNVVSDDDRVYVLGDVLLGRHKANPNAILSRLQGKELHLITGNHDGPTTIESYRWASVQPYLEIIDQNQKIVLCHFKFAIFNKCHKGAVQLFGHSHGGASQNKQQIDVGVDCWNYSPITLREIREKMKTLPDFVSQDHHR